MVVSSFFVSGVKHRVLEKVASQSYVEEGRKGTFVEVLKMPQPCMEESREVRGKSSGKILHSGGQSLQECSNSQGCYEGWTGFGFGP